MTLRTTLTALALSVAVLGTTAAGAFANPLPVIHGPVLPIGHGPVLHIGPLLPIPVDYGYGYGSNWWWEHHHHHHHHHWFPLVY